MALLLLSFIAGVLTVAAPCILPLLPIIIGGSLLKPSDEKPEREWVRPVVIAGSLAVSIILFTLLIKATTALLGIPQQVWQIISGVIVLLLGINFLWPRAWEKISDKTGLSSYSNKTLNSAYKRKGLLGAVLIGSALGPIFSSCSPTYALIVATILPVSFAEGLVYLVAYALGVSITLLLISFLGQAFIGKLRLLSNPTGWFKRTIGILFIVVGIVVIFGVDKKVQAYVLERGWYDPISSLEMQFRE